MKARKAAILAVCFAIVTFQSPTAGVEVSSKVDLDSDENEDTSSNMALGAIEEDSSKSAYTSESVSRTSKQPEAGWRRESEFVKLREPKKRRIHTAVSDTRPIIARSCVKANFTKKKVEPMF